MGLFRNLVRVTIRDIAQEVAMRLKQDGHEAYFAGGCVRDRLLGVEPQDYDIATSALPAQVVKLFPKAITVGAHFGVVIVRMQRVMIEVATFRTDGSYKDGRRPETVEFSTPEEDAQRRDFTVNGLFENPETGEVIDYVCGKADLSLGVLRAIGNPSARFREDGLRLLRAVRFSTRLSFCIDAETRKAMVAEGHLLEKISAERIRDEFSKIITSPRRREGLESLVETGLMKWIVPEFLATIGCEQPPEFHPEGDVYVHTCIMLEMLRDDASLALALAVLFHDIAKPPCRTADEVGGRIRFNGHDAVGARMTEEILRRLRYPNDTVTAVAEMVGRHMQFMNVQHMRVAKLKRFMAAQNFSDEMELHRVDCGSSNGLTDNYDFLLQKSAEFAAEPLIPAPLVTGRDLIQLGMRPGPTFKEILDRLEIEQLEGRILDRERALSYVLTLIAASEA